jgi:predicted ATPase/DNA-binding SARP family transcriptional activator
MSARGIASFDMGTPEHLGIVWAVAAPHKRGRRAACRPRTGPAPDLDGSDADSLRCIARLQGENVASIESVAARAVGNSVDTSLLQVRLLGQFSVSVAGRPTPPALWRRRRAAAVIKLLALAPGHRLHREQVLDALWPDLDPDDAANNLRVVLHYARRGLEDAGAPPDSVLVRDGDALLVSHPAETWVDVDAFAEAVYRAWQSPDPAVVERALALYSGDLLPEDPYEDWAASRRESLRTSFLALLARLAGLHEHRQNFSRAIAAYERLLAAEPLDEGAHVALMRLYAAIGHRELALRQYTRLTELLDRELGAAPDRVVRELADAIREGNLPPTSPALPSPPTDGLEIVQSARLPVPIDALVGRQRELAELERLLSHARLVTLTGPGGVGKTRLAQESARALSARFPDGVAFVDLASLRDPADVLPTVARALSVEESGNRPVVELLAAAIQDRQLLLALDNLEQVIAAAELIRSLLERCANLAVLATSRAPLRVRGEQEYQVHPLLLPDPAERHDADAIAAIETSPAVELFLRRARAARPGFALTEENASAVAAICRKLDGLPLALELAAARVRVIDPHQLLRRLEQPLDALGPGEHDAPLRQRTLRDTVDWSYRLLPRDEQTLLRRLSVFVGGCTLESAEALAAIPGLAAVDTLEQLSTLIEHSLLLMRENPGTEGSRYAMLQTIQEFAAEKLMASTEAEQILAAFQSLILQLAEQAEIGIRGPAQLQWLDRLETEHGNIRAALSASLDEGNDVALLLAPRLWQFWRIRGYAVEGHRWLERAMARADAAPEHRAAAEFALGKLSIDLGDYEASERHFQVSADHWRDAGNDASLSLTLSALSTVMINVGRLEEAEALGEEALAISLHASDDRGAATALLNLGMLAREDGRFDRAVELLNESLSMWRSLADLNFVALAAMNLGTAYRAAGQTERALPLLAESGDLLIRFGDRFNLGVIAHNLGHIEREAGRYYSANRHYAEALRHFEAVDSIEGVVESIEWIAVTATRTGHETLALRLFGAAEAARRKHQLSPLAADARVVEASRSAATAAAGRPRSDELLAAGTSLPLGRARKEALDLAEQDAALNAG